MNEQTADNLPSTFDDGNAYDLVAGDSRTSGLLCETWRGRRRAESWMWPAAPAGFCCAACKRVSNCVALCQKRMNQ